MKNFLLAVFCILVIVIAVTPHAAEPAQTLPAAESFDAEETEIPADAKPDANAEYEDSELAEETAEIESLPKTENDSEICWINGENASNDVFETEHRAVVNSDNQLRSMYCWNSFFENSAAFPELLPLLRKYNINRLYVAIDDRSLKAYQTATMVKNLSSNGVEPVLLLGDRDWVKYGLDDYIDTLNALDKYNSGIGIQNPITAVALDVEADTFDEWQEDPVAGFTEYIKVMQEAYDEAHKRGLRVIQIVSPHLDEVSASRFRTFLKTCCDELSIMNYRKAVNLSAIWNEVMLCRELGIPVETIFETMPLNEYYGVTDERTYFYEGSEALADAEERMTSMYGTQLGIAFHYYLTLYRLETGSCLAAVYPYVHGDSADENGQPVQPGHLILVDPDGNVLSGYTYRATPKSEICYLFTGVLPDVEYKVVLEESEYHSAEKTLVFEAESPDECYLTESIKLRE